MNRRSVSSSHAAKSKDQSDFDASLKAKPRLAEAYLHVTQELYDKQVKSGKLTPAQAKKAKVLVRQFRREMTSFIVRQDLLKIGKHMLRLKKKRRLTLEDMDFLRQYMEKNLPALKRRFRDMLDEEKGELRLFIDKIEFEAVLFGEQFLKQQFGKAKVKMLLCTEGKPLPSEMQKQAKLLLRAQPRPPTRGRR